MKTYTKPISAAIRLMVATAMVLMATLSLTYAAVSKKVALVIGNSQYQTATPLANPGNDATDMSQRLKTLGFDVVYGKDLDLRGLRKTVREFIGKTQGADVALFFYAGHGLQVGGQNYLLPVDASLNREDDLDFETLPVKMVLGAMERNAKATLLFLDACRNNPLSRGLASSMGTRSASVGRGLAEIGSGVGTLISFATKPGAVALDGKGRNSPFTTALLKHIGTPGQDIARTLINVRKDVLVATNRAQVPWENSSLTQRVVLNDVVKPSAPASQVAALQPTTKSGASVQVPASAPRASAGGDSLLKVEMAFWSSVERSRTAESYRTYLSNYPNGAFAQLAQIELRKINAEKSKPKLLPTGKSRNDKSEEPVKVASLGNDKLAAVEPSKIDNKPVQPVQEISEFDRVYGIQKHLTRLGCRPGGVDGIAGRNTSEALARYSRASGNDVRNEGYSSRVLNVLSNEKTIYCPTKSRKRVASLPSSRKKKAVKTRNVSQEPRTKRVKKWKAKPKAKAKKKWKAKPKKRRVVKKQRRVVKRRSSKRSERRKRANAAAVGLAVGLAAGALLLRRR